jgi:hypothetical protein
MHHFESNNNAVLVLEFNLKLHTHTVYTRVDDALHVVIIIWRKNFNITELLVVSVNYLDTHKKMNIRRDKWVGGIVQISSARWLSFKHKTWRIYA